MQFNRRQILGGAAAGEAGPAVRPCETAGFHGISVFQIRSGQHKIGVFTLFGCAADKTGAPRKEKSPGVFGKFVLEIDKCSFGIYLIHMIFVRGILKHTKLHPYGAGSPFVLIGLTLGIFLVSFILTWILKKIPGVKKIL